MRIGRATTAIFLRGIVFCFVVAAVGPAAWREMPSSAHLASFSRACIGFFASVTVTVVLMLALSAAGSPAVPEAAALGLRGSI